MPSTGKLQRCCVWLHPNMATLGTGVSTVVCAMVGRRARIVRYVFRVAAHFLSGFPTTLTRRIAGFVDVGAIVAFTLARAAGRCVRR